MAKNPFRTSVGSQDKIFQKAALQARFGKQFDEKSIQAAVGGLGGNEYAQGFFEIADLVGDSNRPNLVSGLDPKALAARFGQQLQGQRQLLPGQAIDWSKLSEYEQEDNTHGSQTLNCSGDVCEVVDIL